MKRGPWAAETVALVMVTALVTGPVLGRLVASLLASLATDPGVFAQVGIGRLGSSLLAAVVIGSFSVLIGAPAGLAARGWRGVRLGLLLMPTLLPSFLVYAGWNLARAPGTPIGDGLLRMAADGERWAPQRAGEVLAVLGLGVWASPIAALIVAFGANSVGRDVFDSLASDAGPIRRWLETLSIVRGSIVLAFALVVVLMLGSAVPLHVAQMPTIANGVWLELAQRAPGDQAGAWVTAWPVILAACLAAWLVSGQLTAQPAASERLAPETPRGGGFIATAVMLTLGVLVPFGLFAWDLGSLAPLGRFWTESGSALGSSLGVSALGAAMLAPVPSLVGATLARSPMQGRACVALLVLMSLMPGVLIGSALVELRAEVESVLGQRFAFGPLPGALGLAARHAGLAALLGVMLFRADASALRDLRSLESPRSIPGRLGLWFRATLPMQLPLITSGLIAILFLGLHEIESSVLLRPPGSGNLAAKLLADLHYQRVSMLSAASITLIGLGGALLGLLVGVGHVLKPWR
ncbi:MAG: hypothetical protein AAGB51_08750 [Planctomycetota bacterium]